MRIVVDENLPPLLAEVLRALGHDASHVSQLGLSGLEDVEWLPKAKAHADVVFSTDANMARRHSEVEALRQAGLLLFVFPSGGHLKEWVLLFLLREADIQRAADGASPHESAWTVKRASVQKVRFRR